MKNFIPILILLFNASTATAQSQPYRESASTISSQQLVIAAVNLTVTHPPLAADANVPKAPAPPLPGTASGIGPSPDLQPGDYGYSPLNDLKQLNF